LKTSPQQHTIRTGDLSRPAESDATTGATGAIDGLRGLR